MHSGAFKFRGAMNSVASLTEEEAMHGVVAHSSGNHAAAVALAAKLRGIPAYIVLPTDTPQVVYSFTKLWKLPQGVHCSAHLPFGQFL